MSLLRSGVTQALNIFYDMKEAVHNRDSRKFSECLMQIDAILNQQLQYIDEEFQCGHTLRKQAVEYVENLNRCKRFVGKEEGISLESNFDTLENDLLESAKSIFLLEYALKKDRPKSMLLKND